MPTYGSKWPVYAKQWDAMKIGYFKGSPSNSVLALIKKTAKNIVAAKSRYQVTEQATGVPWWWIGPTHVRESDQDWNASLAQGDPWRRVSTHVPAGRGPFASWEAAAIDALQLQGLTRVIDWRLEKAIYHWEAFNGWGYYAHGLPSPYCWGGSDQQRPGKYIADGRWSSGTWDTQLGTCAMLEAMMELDSSIKPVRED